MAKDILLNFEIKAAPSKVWQALTDPKLIDEWGGGPAQMDEKVGTEFYFWGGDIYGKNIASISNKKLVQEWFGDKDWQKPSIVTFELEPQNSGTKLTLKHTDIPDDREDEFAVGWQEFYIGPMKEMLEKINKLID